MKYGFHDVEPGLYKFIHKDEYDDGDYGWPLHSSPFGDSSKTRHVKLGDIIFIIERNDMKEDEPDPFNPSFPMPVDELFWRLRVITSQGIGWLMLKRSHEFIRRFCFESL